MPVPADISAAVRLAAEGYQLMRVGVDDEGQDGLLRGMVEELMRGVEGSVGKVEGVGDGFLDGEFFLFCFFLEDFFGKRERFLSRESLWRR